MPEDKSLTQRPGEAAGTSIVLQGRLGVEIPKPKDWQAFQRNCTLLFREELRDPHAQEYGRSGQDQRGIDILARRNGKHNHFVGVQCRLITKPIKKAKMLADAREALTLKADLKELIFATTAPDDTGATDAAIEVTQTLQAEGHDLQVVVYGWGHLQNRIAVCDIAYNAFQPSAVANSNPQSSASSVDPSELAGLVAKVVIERMASAGIIPAPSEGTSNSDEDPGLHARIDTFRDLFKDSMQPTLAQSGLLNILNKEDLSAKPWARYRVETNLGSIALSLGREPEAAERFETAHAIRPEDPNAIANLALARIVQGRFDEAMEVAQTALDGNPRPEHAISYLLQAAARSDWEGEAETLIPQALAGSAHAELGLAEFIRYRELPDWAERSVEIARRHTDVPEFKRINALAVLALALKTGDGAVTGAELNAAADDMKALAERLLDTGFSDNHDLAAHLNNAAVLLQRAERHEESEHLLMRGLKLANSEPQLPRLLAISRAVQGRFKDAVAALLNETDPESRILLAEMRASTGDTVGGLTEALAIDPVGLSERLRRLRWRVVGETALRLKDTNTLKAAVAGLRQLNKEDVAASILEIRADGLDLADRGVLHERFKSLAASIPADLDIVSSYMLAGEFLNHGLPEEASRAIEQHVDLTKKGPITSLYLRSLAEARRDSAFETALSRAAAEVRNNPDTVAIVASHAWNLGDLDRSLTATEEILLVEPDNPRARLLKIEILIRLDRSTELFQELDKPVELLAWSKPGDQFRLASLLGHFGFVERAAAFAYQLFLEHRDVSRAWMTLSALILDLGEGEDDPRLWTVETAGENAAVDLAYDDGTEVFFVIEPDTNLRRIDQESWEPEHALAQAVWGRVTESRFRGPDGREGVVRQVRHKYVARLHYVMQHHETRFPEIFGFRKVQMDFEQPGGLDDFVGQLKARQEWIQEEEGQYLHGVMPLCGLAHRLGMDTVEVGAGLVSRGHRLKVASGNIEVRKAAMQKVRLNRLGGCVLDLFSFWTAWRLGALYVVNSTCGQIFLPQSVLDRLRAKREQYSLFSRSGYHGASTENGKIVIQQTSPAVVAGMRDEVDKAIAWAETHATVSPVMAGDELPSDLREHLRRGHSDMFDSLILARHTSSLLVTDDGPIRDLDVAYGGNGGVWLSAVLTVALERKHVGFDEFIGWYASLIQAGHNYLGINGQMLARAAHLDHEKGSVPGHLLRTLSQEIGGRTADPPSHIQAIVGCLQMLWLTPSTRRFREPATGYLLRQIIRDRPDYAPILAAIFAQVSSFPGLPEYILKWLQGHFLLVEVRKIL